jgi:methyltransferase
MTMTSLLAAPPLWALAVVLLVMVIEALISSRNERRLRARGSYEPEGDVYRTMRWAYPAVFVVMAAEGIVRGRTSSTAITAGVALLAASKALKVWAIQSLGARWTFRVLVPPGEPLVTTGPYALMRHPNYVAVVGELVSMALLTGAWLSGPTATLVFGLLLRKRIRLEDGVLRHHPCSPGSGLSG